MSVTSDNMSGRTLVMVAGLALAAEAFFVTRLVAPFVVDLTGWNSTLVGIGIRTILAVVCFVALGGASWLRFDLGAVGRTWRFMGYLVVIDILLGFLALSARMGTIDPNVLEQATPASVGGNFALITVLCILAGFNEEVLFRGLVFSGLLAMFGGKKSGVILSAAVSGLLFGFAHVIGDIDLANTTGTIQALAKALGTAMYGFILCYPVLKDKNLGGAISFHGFGDWVIVISYVFTGLPSGLGVYVSSDAETSMASTVVLAVMGLIYLPKCIKAYKLIMAGDAPQYGPFVVEEAVPAIPKARHYAA